MISAALRAQLSDPDHSLASIPDDVLRDALRDLDDETDEGVVATLVLLAWHRRLLSVKPAPPAREPAPPSEFVRLMAEFAAEERERRLRLARAT